jgi:uncharacterized protein (TIGR01777 family)
MRVVIAGGSGLLGAALTSHLAAHGHNVVVLTRQRTTRLPARSVTYEPWSPTGQTGPWARVLDGAHAIVNLAGESIAEKRWSAAQKAKILDSRLMATRSLAAALQEAIRKPRALISGSAVGYYGDRGDETLTEASGPGSDYLAGVCQQWEAAANSVANLTRVALIRTGIVLDHRGGALPKMLTPFRFFAGGPIGSGRQYMPWIHKDDWVRLVTWALASEAVQGPVNATAPKPVTNSEFSKALGHALGRPSFMPAPGFALRIALGEMADALLLSGQRALPVRATDLGFPFGFANVDDALADILRKPAK